MTRNHRSRMRSELACRRAPRSLDTLRHDSRGVTGAMQERKDEDAVIGLVDLVIDFVALCHAMTDSSGKRLAHVEVDAEQAGVIRKKDE